MTVTMNLGAAVSGESDGFVESTIHPRTGVWLVTPEVAQYWLAHSNTLNERIRPISEDYVAELANDIQQGRWVLTNASIGFLADGQLCDGQHRLAAIVAAGVAVPVRITTALSKDAAAYIDTGRKRSHTSAFRFEGYRNPSIASAVARLLYRRGSGRVSANPANGTLARYASTIPDLDDVCAKAQELYKEQDFRMFRPMCIAAVPLLFRAHEVEAWRFLTAITTATDIEVGSPEHVLRKRQSAVVLGDGRGHRSSRREPAEAELHALCYAFAARLSGARPKRIVLKSKASLTRLPGLDYDPKFRR